MLIIAKQLDRRHRRIRAPVHDHLIQDIMRPIRMMCMVVLALLANQLLDEVARFRGVGFVGVGAHDCGFEAQAQRHCYAFLESARDGCRVEFVVEFRQEAEGAEGEG